jgi:hypothetical protein
MCFDRQADIERETTMEKLEGAEMEREEEENWKAPAAAIIDGDLEAGRFH